ncbi:hypothetical protein HMPREF1981_03275 [Bacteroides pyogenes F0041]|uniref:Uncharacterized protein n=1 Tax=Bacteroides pyogenes F0041 TaxID=1321819 RepID=U2BST7_9BACE|nr:hypothetical protein HMPREF1981_03275 [Bacteroides pyogenes F0041]
MCKEKQIKILLYQGRWYGEIYSLSAKLHHSNLFFCAILRSGLF